jgi:apolipoprotein N-acyltransferase
MLWFYVMGAILSGIMIGTSYIPFPPWAIFFCFVPLWRDWLKLAESGVQGSYRKIWWRGWVTQFLLTLIGFNWVAHTVHEFGHLPWVAAVFCLFGFCAFANLHIPIAGVLWFAVSRLAKLNRRQKMLLLPAVLAACEWTFPMIFDWNFGYTWLYARFPGVHWADVVGIQGLSHIGIFANLFFLWIAESERSILWKARQVGWFVAGFMVFNALGYWHYKQLPVEDAHVRVAVVQANIGNFEKQVAQSGLAFRGPIIHKFLDLSRQALTQNGPADLVFWPETAFPDLLSTDRIYSLYLRDLSQLTQEFHTTLVTGAFGIQPNGQYTNSLFVIGPDGQIAKPSYAKTVLLAFGEYFPGANYFPILLKWFPEVGNFGRGPGPTVITSGPLHLGAQICYEGLFDWFARGLADKGAQIVANVTNDSWYGTWQQPYQHGYMTLSRGLEIRRAVVRSTNTGISTVISPRGEIQEFSPLNQEWTHVYDLPYYTQPPRTLFERIGYILEPLSLVLWMVGVVLL